MDDFLLQFNDVAAGEVWRDGRSAHLVEVMLDSIGRGMGMSELVDVPAVLVKLFVVVDLVIEGRVIDMQFVWVNPDDWSYLYSAHTSITPPTKVPTIFLMHLLDDPRILAPLEYLIVEFIPHRRDCEFPARELCKRAKIETIDNQQYCRGDRDSEPNSQHRDLHAERKHGKLVNAVNDRFQILMLPLRIVFRTKC